MTFTHGSLFAGCGGFDVAADRVGWQVLWQVEINNKCQQVLEFHWPTAKRYTDICDVTGSDLAPVDCITFGSPCQDLSIAGQRAGLSGERSNLFYEAVRVIREMRNATDNQFPRWVIWENVPGAFTSNAGRDFAAVIDALAELGPVGIEWAVLDAQYFGVPQRRRRIFLASGFDSATFRTGGEPLFPLSESLRRSVTQGKTQEQSIANTLRAGSAGSRPGLDLDKMTFIPTVVSTVTSKWAKGTGGPSGDECQNLVPVLNTFDNGEVRTSILAAPAAGVRRLTPLECERLQGFPDFHTAKGIAGPISDSARYRMLGNAVAVPCAQWVMEQINKQETQDDHVYS